MTEERARYEVLFEQIQADFRVFGEQQNAMAVELRSTNERLDRIETTVDRLEIKVDVLDRRVGNLETKVGNLETKVDKLETKVDKLDVFAGDAQQRLGRIETHLQLNGSNPHKPTRAAPARQSKKR
jgi:chromosome segregation ATPase